MPVFERYKRGFTRLLLRCRAQAQARPHLFWHLARRYYPLSDPHYYLYALAHVQPMPRNRHCSKKRMHKKCAPMSLIRTETSGVCELSFSFGLRTRCVHRSGPYISYMQKYFSRPASIALISARCDCSHGVRGLAL
jgi:hypothetical protein